jgi:methyl-accepting chemotaxis protein
MMGAGLNVFVNWASRRPKLTRLGSWLMLIYSIVTISSYLYSLGPAQPVAGIFILPIIMSLFLLPWYGTLLVTAAALLVTFLTTLIEFQPLVSFNGAGATILNLIVWVFVLTMPAALGLYLLAQLNNGYKQALAQNSRILEAWEKVENKRQLGQSVSARLQSVSAELNAASSQQASGSQQQVAAIQQITAFLQELSQTASEITTRGATINNSAENVLASARQVKQTTQIVTERGELGVNSVKRTINSNQRITALYQSLVQVLEELNERSFEIKRVNNLIKDVSDEMHLLALNAAIEAAGAGEYGERFGVVAQEVKSLSNRSIQASKEVTAILGQVSQQIEVAVEAAGECQTETRSALVVAQESGEVMNELIIAIDQSALEVAKIEETASEMGGLTQEITLATSQQYSGSKQAVETLQEIGTIARQSASGSIQIIVTAREMENFSQELVETLAV